ncbi:MAG: response regulator transcription factor [Campylobacteraceae bacterium]|nr:response regulator transcription factor [Campylobacteraceae bacterium]
MKILLMEDDEILNDVIRLQLESKGYEICSVYDGEEAEAAICESNFDLLLFDVNVPSINGFELLKTLRASSINTPAIFITSLNDTEDLKQGFNSGCDDYIKKPFEFKELELRIENIKRLYKLDLNHIVEISLNTTYDFNTATIIKDEKKHVLSKKELKVFEYFLKNKKRIISMEELSLNVWTYDDRPNDSTIRTYIKNFRKILSSDVITTIKGVGYLFN